MHLLLLHCVYISCLTCSSSLPMPPCGFLSLRFCLYFVSFLLNLLCSFSPHRSSVLPPFFLFLCSLSSLLVRNVCGNWSSFLLTVRFQDLHQVLAVPIVLKLHAPFLILSLGRQGSSHPFWLLTDLRRSPSDWSSLCSFSSFLGSVSESFLLLPVSLTRWVLPSISHASRLPSLHIEIQHYFVCGPFPSHDRIFPLWSHRFCAL